MKLSIFIFSILTFFEIKTKVSALIRSVPKQCNEVYSKSSVKYVPYEETYETRNWIGARKYKTRVNYKLQTFITNHTRETCCPGYTEFGSGCRPFCSKDCGQNGYCAFPEHCSCDHGYALDYQVDQCKPVCTDECFNGYCAAPNTCRCKNGYRMLPGNTACSPICDSCDVNESCVEPHVCSCSEGYSRLPHSRLDSEKTGKCQPVCNRPCVNGVCVTPNVCQCNTGYGEFDGDEFTCEPFCSPKCVHGDCTHPNVCTCHSGFQLAKNSTRVCEPFCSKGCVNGTCTAPEKCSCLDGYLTTQENHICKPFCSKGCVNGVCTAPEKCSCLNGYSPTHENHICEPFCPEGCINGICTAPDRCTCLEGYDRTLEKHMCVPHCDSGCEHGRCIAPDKCACDAGYEPEDSTCAPICIEGCTMGMCVAPNTCECERGYKLANGSISECVPSCKDDCVHGTCTAPDECTCNDGYEMVNSTDGSSKCIVICECENGYCSDTNSTCQSCAEGYELFSDGNSTSCKPHCKGDCEHGQCVEPQKCECDEYYVASNDTLGNPICAHACGGECGHGTCSLDNGLCSCLYGWLGKHCEEPSACSVAVSEGHSVYSQFNGSGGFEDYENATEIEEPWTGPICNNLCTGVINNTTRCANQSNGEQAIFVCFLDINSPCNTHTVVQANTSTGHVNYTLLTTSIVVLLLAITALTVGMFIRKRRLEKSKEFKKTELSSQRIEEDNLIENENDGISL